MTKYTKKEVLKAIEGANGVMEYVANRLGCTWRTARKYVDNWSETLDEFEKTETNLHSVAYQSFHKAISNGERWAIERILDTSARRNGHGTVDHKKVDHSSEDGSMSPTPEAQKAARDSIKSEFDE